MTGPRVILRLTAELRDGQNVNSPVGEKPYAVLTLTEGLVELDASRAETIEDEVESVAIGLGIQLGRLVGQYQPRLAGEV